MHGQFSKAQAHIMHVCCYNKSDLKFPSEFLIFVVQEQELRTNYSKRDVDLSAKSNNAECVN